MGYIYLDFLSVDLILSRKCKNKIRLVNQPSCVYSYGDML